MQFQLPGIVLIPNEKKPKYMKPSQIKIPARQISPRSANVAIDKTTRKSSVQCESPLQSDQQHLVIYRTFPKAKTVLLSGSFSGWKPVPASLQDRWCGIWRADLMLKPGRYEYRFVVDGEWTDDVGNPNRVVNPFGSYNNVLTVEISDHTKQQN
jgi:1,4-alpha-glucan branching enzyme